MLLAMRRDSWEVLLQKALDALLVLRIKLTVYCQGIGDWLSSGVLSDLEAEAVDLRVTVKDACRCFIEKDRAAICGGVGGVGDLVPEHGLTTHSKANAEVAKQGGRPGAGGDDQTVRCIGSSFSSDNHPGAFSAPSADRFTAAHLCTELYRLANVGQHARLHPQVARL